MACQSDLQNRDFRDFLPKKVVKLDWADQLIKKNIFLKEKIRETGLGRIINLKKYFFLREKSVKLDWAEQLIKKKYFFHRKNP